MVKKPIINHGLLYDTINYDSLIKAQANTPTFLNYPKEYNSMISKNYDNKSKQKKLTLSYKKVVTKKYY